MKRFRILLFISVLSALCSCMPTIHPQGEKKGSARIDGAIFRTTDGANLPLRFWLPKTDPKAVIIALHGFNDYSRFFDQPGKFFKGHGIASYAYDQRGFGAAPKRRLWAGNETYADDLTTLIHLLQQRYPRVPLYLLGESMGGAVILTAMGRQGMPPVDGIILAAPALWARETMPWYQTSLLWFLAHSMPWLTLTGEGLRVTPSDNVEMLRELGRDPWVIKGARVESLYGLADLMDAAFETAKGLHADTLMLYGEKDEIIPKEPTYLFLKRFLSISQDKKTIAIYKQGYHMLLRDLNAAETWQDIAAWIDGNRNNLPSGADEHALTVMSLFLTNPSK
ncbi:MAG: alpha/beta hydrolase [Gammaproteobacteria bacterium]